MSTSSLHKIHVRLAEAYKFTAKVFLFNATNQSIEPTVNYGTDVAFEVPTGLYTLRCGLNADFVDVVLFAEQDLFYFVDNNEALMRTEEVLIVPPKQFSSALLGFSYGSSHEYYTYPAVDMSQTDTLQHHTAIDASTNSSLFLFMRFPSKEVYDAVLPSLSQPFFEPFEIRDVDYHLIADFKDPTCIKYDNHFGWLAFNAQLKPGVYYLFYTGKNPRQTAIYVYPNWHTQFFMTLGEEPLFGTIRIFLSPIRVFEFENDHHKYVDILMDKLQNRDFGLDEALLHLAANAEFVSPMLSLLCTYIYLSSQETKDDGLFRAITDNLQRNVLMNSEYSADLLALNLLAQKHNPDYTFSMGSVHGTPMFRIGFEAILQAALTNDSLIPQGSLNDYVSENLYYDSPVSTFKPVLFNAEKSKVEIQKESNLNIEYSLEDTKSVGSIENLATDDSSGSKKLLDKETRTHIKEAEGMSEDGSWLKTSIAELLMSNSKIQLDEISEKLSIAKNTISRILDEWKDEAKSYKK